MKKSLYYLSITLLVGFFVMLNIEHPNLNPSHEYTLLNQAQAQSGTDYMSCGDHPDDCDSSVAGCEGGVEDISACTINCPPYFGSPWLYCDGNTDPAESD